MLNNHRFLVIGEYPNSQFEIGSILERLVESESQWYGSVNKLIGISDLKKYPNLFRELKWWEHRSIDEMPNYVKDKSAIPARYIKTEIWDYDPVYGYNYTINERKQYVSMWAMEPSTEQEYDSY